MNNKVLKSRITTVLTLLCMLLGSVISTYAQQTAEKTISGVVTDDEKEPLIGASVVVPGTGTQHGMPLRKYSLQFQGQNAVFACCTGENFPVFTVNTEPLPFHRFFQPCHAEALQMGWHGCHGVGVQGALLPQQAEGARIRYARQGFAREQRGFVIPDANGAYAVNGQFLPEFSGIQECDSIGFKLCFKGHVVLCWK